MTKTKRIIRVVEHWALGLSAFETAETMKAEGYRISVHTVYNDRHSATAQQYVDELVRRQLRDIEDAKLAQKLYFRDKLLGKLIPQKLETFSVSKIEQHVKIDVSEDEASCLNRAASILDKRLQKKKQPVSIH